MELGNIERIMREKNASNVRVPDLDWLMLTNEDSKNIPTPHDVEIIPQLQETWGNTDASSAKLISNKIRSEESKAGKIASEDINGVIDTAKKEMMQGLNGKFLASKLASTYPKNLIAAAKKDLMKLAEEQGLLGSVYVDISPYDSCEQASEVLGKNKIRLAKYVVGEPKRKVCSSHHTGYCKHLGKKVVPSIEYNSSLLYDYTNHLHIAGILKDNERVNTKEELRNAILKSASVREPSTFEANDVPEVEEEKPIEGSVKDLQKALMSDVEKIVPQTSETAGLKPVLAFIQNEMLKGKMGEDLKESISHKITNETIKKYASQIKKAVSLQGLLGNVYVDISYYNKPQEAIQAIKNASTSPSYIIQTEPGVEYDNTLEKIANATGCEVLPRNGNIKPVVANSYIDDLQFNSRISSDMAVNARKRIESGDNILGILRDVYKDSMGYSPPVKEGGQTGRFHQNVSHKYANRDRLKKAVYTAVEAGFPIEKIENKLMEEIPAVEAVGMIRNVISSVKEIDANVLDNCTKEKYQFSHDASLKKASKCNDCVRAIEAGCTALGLKFAAEEKSDIVSLDPKTEKVLLKENPDVERENVNKEFDMPDYSGSNLNVKLDEMRSQQASESNDFNISYNMNGIDMNLQE